MVVVVEALAIVDELVIEDDAYVVVNDGDSAGGLDGDGIAHDAGYSHAETVSDGVGVVHNHTPEAHDSDPADGFEHNFHGLDAYCMDCKAREVDDCTESGGANKIHASLGMEVEVAHQPKSWVSSGETVNAAVGEPVANEEKEGTDDSSIGSQVLVFLVHLGSCNV